MARLRFSDESFPAARVVHYLCFDETTRETWLEVHLNEVPHVREDETEVLVVALNEASSDLLHKALGAFRDLPADIAARVKHYADLP